MTWVAVGTAAAIGAGVGGVSAAARGDDVLEGALIGGATGAVTGGAGAALGSTAASTVGTELGKEVGKEVAKEAVTEVAKEGITQAATEGVNQAATEGINQGITQLGQPAVPAAPAGIEQIQPVQGFNQAELNAIQEGQNLAAQSGASPYYDTASTGNELVSKRLDIDATKEYGASYDPTNGIFRVNPPTPSPTSMTESDLAQMSFAETGQYPAQPLATTPPNTPIEAPYSGPSSLISEPPTNPFLEGYNSVKDFVKANPFESAVLGYTGLTMLGGSNQGSGQAISEEQNKANRRSQSTISPNFRPGPYSQPNVYQEKRYNYALGGVAGMQNSYDDENGSDMASGGIASFAKGTPKEKDPEADFARYYAMMEGQKPEQPSAPSYVGRVGIAYDDDQDTRYQDPLTAALIRQGKVSKRAGIPTGPVISRPKPLGTINLAPPGTQQAASGGIMGYNLGGYADGGNPRLLKGPGDGMSDNIPAVIGSSQPARLADGEFVVPADVVSHLGNGSTDAGAKKLHQMMDKIRMARTGKKKQAPAVKPKKYMPA